MLGVGWFAVFILCGDIHLEFIHNKIYKTNLFLVSLSRLLCKGKLKNA